MTHYKKRCLNCSAYSEWLAKYTVLVYILFAVAVSKLLSLHYPVDDANVLQTSLCLVFI